LDTRLLAITTGTPPDACGERVTLLGGIRRVAQLVAPGWARLYKDHASRSGGIRRTSKPNMEGGRV
jgi:hypothetical protein